jgi:AcrR family transcriptional regulator
MAGDIKQVARELMHEHGTAGLTLRGIAREMGLTAPAIYHYYPRLDDLITALIIDAYEAVAAAIEDAIAGAEPAGPVRQLVASFDAFRAWGLRHRIEFQLIYGNPIPGYSAPDEVTTPLARRPFAAIGQVLFTLEQEGRLAAPPSYVSVPPTIAAHFAIWRAMTGYPVSDLVLYLVIAGWTRIHGIVSLELIGHLQPPLGDTEAFYRHELSELLRGIGLPS